MSDRLSQKQKLLDYLRVSDEGITTFDAFTLLNITSLHKIISNLELDGHRISREYDVKNGKKQNYKRYRLLRETDDGE